MANNEFNELKELIVFSSIILLIALIFSFALFGFTGVRVVLGIIFVSLPFYFILNNFELEEGEKFIFSVLFGLTLFSSSAYLLGLLMSFRISIIITFILLLVIALAIRKYKKFQAQ